MERSRVAKRALAEIARDDKLREDGVALARLIMAFWDGTLVITPKLRNEMEPMVSIARAIIASMDGAE